MSFNVYKWAIVALAVPISLPLSNIDKDVYVLCLIVFEYTKKLTKEEFEWVIIVEVYHIMFSSQQNQLKNYYQAGAMERSKILSSFL